MVSYDGEGNFLKMCRCNEKNSKAFALEMHSMKLTNKACLKMKIVTVDVDVLILMIKWFLSTQNLMIEPL